MKQASLLRLFLFLALAAFASVGNTATAGPQLVIEQPVGTLRNGGTVVAWGNSEYGKTVVPPGLNNVTAISAGKLHTVALISNGTVVAWGYQGSGITTVPNGLTGVTAIAAGYQHSVALKNDGTVVAWGYNNNGQTTVPLGLTGVIAIAAGDSHTVALKNDGTVVAWGDNFHGQTTIPLGLSGVTAIAAGYSHTVALKNDGTVVAWGYNLMGMMAVPSGLTGVMAIAAGGVHTVALKSDGTVVAWGYNIYDQATVPLGLTDVRAIAACNFHTVALKTDGTVVAWGNNNLGQTIIHPDLIGVAAIAAGYDHTVALTEPTVNTFGGEVVGRIGSPLTITIKNAGNENLTLGTITKEGANASEFAVSAPEAATLVPGGSTTFTATFTPSGLGNRTALIRIPNNESGRNPFNLVLAGIGLPSDNATLSGLEFSTGTLSPAFTSETTTYTASVPKATSSLTLTPIRSEGHPTITVNGTPVMSGTASGSISLKIGDNIISTVVTAENGKVMKTYTITVARAGPHLVVEQPSGIPKDYGTLVAWGDNGYGQATVSPLMTGVTAIAADNDRTVALKSNGTVVAWGYNNYGQATVPLGLTDVVAIAAGYQHTVALKSNGTVVAWGSNNHGQTTVPLGLTNVTAIAAGYLHTVALKNDGTVVAWGYNGSGETTVPAGLTGVTAVAAGNGHTVALKANGTVVAWGSNGSGQTTVPPGLTGVTAIAVGQSHTVALKSDGTVVAWGYNYYGQSTVPPGLTGVTAIAAGGFRTVALRDAGTVVAWGLKRYTTVPPELAGVTAIAAGSFHTVALVKTPVHHFGSQPVGHIGAPVTFTIKNTGNEELGLGTITKDGVSSDDFTVSIPGADSLAPGGSTTFSVTFSPATSGNRTALMHIPSNESGTSPFDLVLAGISLPTLSGLELSTGTLSPSFTSATNTYTATVPNATNTLTLTPTHAEPHATITINGTPVISGTASGNIALKIGDNAITAVVTSQDGMSMKTYTVTVARTAPHLVLEEPSGTQKNKGTVVAWGLNSSGQTNVPAGLTDVTAVAAAESRGLALKSDGTVVTWGGQSYGELIVPSGLSGVTAIAAGRYHTVALKSNGTVVAWGYNGNNVINVPSDLTDVTAIAAGGYHTVALKGNGTVVAWGDNNYGDVTVPSGLTGVTAITAGYRHTVALKSNGTVVAWGNNSYGQLTVPSGLTGVTAIAAGVTHTVALKSDGTVVAWGGDDYGVITSPTWLTNVTAIAAGGDYSVGGQTLALKSDGTVVALSNLYYGERRVPEGLKGVTAIAAGAYSNLALIGIPRCSLGIQTRNSTSIPHIFTIKNTGNENLILGAITKDGVNSADFTVSTPASSTIAPGGSTTFTVTFTPGDLGERTAMIHIESNDSNFSPFDLILSGTGVLTPLETWRQAYFGTAANTGDAADLADPDQDGIANLLEHALGLNPNNRNLLPVTTTEGGATMQFTYTRSKAAFESGLIFQVQSRDGLASGTWGTADVSPETILDDDGTTQTVRVNVSAASASHFLRLSVTAP